MERLTRPPDVGPSLIDYLAIAFGDVPILGDLIEVLTGTEDGDYDDLGTWVSTLLDAAALVAGIADFVNGLIALLTGVPVIGDDVEKLAGTINAKQLGVPLSFSINPDEDATFPRAMLTHGAASGTNSGGSGDTSHSHGLGQIPQYKPAGNGSDMLEIGYIRATKRKTYRYVGFGTGGAATLAGIEAAYISVFSIDISTGAATELTSTLGDTDIKGSVTTQNKEFRFDMGVDIEAEPGDVFAVCLLQQTSIIQTCANLLCTTLTDITNGATGQQYPAKNYGYIDRSSSSPKIPSSFTHANINYGSSEKIPFFLLSPA